MKSSILFTLSLFLSSFLFSQTTGEKNQSKGIVLYANFNPGLSMPAGWQSIDADGDGYFWNISESSGISNSGGFISYSRIGEELTHSNYLISPLVNGADSLYFWMTSYPDYADHYAVMASTTGTNIADFTTVFEEDIKASTWVQKKCKLPAGTKYIAFRHFGTVGWYIKLDEVTVTGTAPTTPVAACSPLSWTTTTEIGYSTQSNTFNIANVGVDTLRCTAVEGLAAPFSFSDETFSPTNIALKQNEEISFYFNYEPTVVDTIVQTVIFRTNGGDITITLTGQCYEPDPVTICNFNSWDISLAVGETATSKTFRLTNEGGSTVKCTGITGLSAPFTTTLNPDDVSLSQNQSIEFNFIYSPTVAGSTQQNVTILTNGGNINITLKGTAQECSSITTFPWAESFDTGTFPSCWSKIDADGDGYEWISFNEVMQPTGSGFTGSSFAHSGADLLSSWSFLPTLFNQNTYSFYGIDLNTNNYLITPAITIPSETTLKPIFKYYIRNFWQNNFDYYKLMLSNTGKNLEDFNVELKPSSMVDWNTWKADSIDLSEYKGKTIYIAFVHHSYARYGLLLDDVSLNLIDNSYVKENEISNISIYPNPASNMVYISSNDVAVIEIYDLVGNLVLKNNNKNSIDVSNLKTGSYIINVITEKTAFLRKINIFR